MFLLIRLHQTRSENIIANQSMPTLAFSLVINKQVNFGHNALKVTINPVRQAGRQVLTQCTRIN